MHKWATEKCCRYSEALFGAWRNEALRSLCLNERLSLPEWTFSKNDLWTVRFQWCWVMLLVLTPRHSIIEKCLSWQCWSWKPFQTLSNTGHFSARFGFGSACSEKKSSPPGCGATCTRVITPMKAQSTTKHKKYIYFQKASRKFCACNTKRCFQGCFKSQQTKLQV